jgi:hypothetical protein
MKPTRAASVPQEGPEIGHPDNDRKPRRPLTPVPPDRRPAPVSGDPLATCPRSLRARWARRAEAARRSYRAAVELKCLECCAWDRPKAKRCEIHGCPLWEIACRNFGRAGESRS